MGVLACSRTGCENIMCDHYSSEHGYICWECLRELKGSGVCDIDAFMWSEKGSRKPPSISDWEYYVNTVFVDRG